MSKCPGYTEWHIPFKQGEITLREARASLACVSARPQSIPFSVKLMENPRYHIPGITLFHGAATLEQHDAIHLLLGRGLLPKDEAFAIGFTMGSTRKVRRLEERAFGWIAHRLYPSDYRLGNEELSIFHDAIKLAGLSRCQPLNDQDYDAFFDMPLNTIRRRLHIEPELMLAYYAVEKKRFPQSRASQRLLDDYGTGRQTGYDSSEAA